MRVGIVEAGEVAHLVASAMRHMQKKELVIEFIIFSVSAWVGVGLGLGSGSGLELGSGLGWGWG